MFSDYDLDTAHFNKLELMILNRREAAKIFGTRFWGILQRGNFGAKRRKLYLMKKVKKTH